MHPETKWKLITAATVGICAALVSIVWLELEPDLTVQQAAWLTKATHQQVVYLERGKRVHTEYAKHMKEFMSIVQRGCVFEKTTDAQALGVAADRAEATSRQMEKLIRDVDAAITLLKRKVTRKIPENAQ